MAKALYDYWFVQFDFPDKSGKPYKSSGGKMVSDKSLKINIPAEWQVQTLDNILTLEYGKPLKKEGRSNSGYPVYGSNGIVGYHKHFIAEGPGIVVGRKGSAGEIIRTNECFYPIDTAYYILDRLGVKSLSFHYQLLRVCDLKKIESSSAVPGLNRNTVYAIKTIVPPIALIHHYNEYADALYHKIDINTKQNNQLVNLRDWLLPMLMNGQVKIA